MRNLFLLSMMMVMCLAMTLIAQAQQSRHTRAPNMLERSPGWRTPDIWKKFIGEETNRDLEDIPNLTDFSYAGFKNGTEGIPEADDPRISHYTVVDVTDHNVIPNDGRSDTDALRALLNSEHYRDNIIVYFPPGHYDFYMDGDTDVSEIRGRKYVRNVIFRGSGAGGYTRNGTTLRIHNAGSSNFTGLISTSYLGVYEGTRVTGTHSRGGKSFTVDNPAMLHFPTEKYIILSIDNSRQMLEHHVSVSDAEIAKLSMIKNGVDITEFNEIDRIEGNRVYLKAPLLTPLTYFFKVRSAKMTEFTGFEDFHVDGGIRTQYVHHDFGRSGFKLKAAAHSWIKDCRFTGTNMGFIYDGCYAVSSIGLIYDGRVGHYPAIVGGSTYSLIGLLEENTVGTPAGVDGGLGGSIHGPSISGKTAGIVLWGIAGSSIRGPDNHGNQPRQTLYDNYRSSNHETCSGAARNYPHHLDGYTKWNNVAKTSTRMDLWTEVSAGSSALRVSQGNIIGYDTDANSDSNKRPANAWVEGFGEIVNPVSLYAAQLEHRLGYRPAWLDESIEEFKEFTRLVESTPSNSPLLSETDAFTITIPEDSTEPTLHTFRGFSPVGADYSFSITGTDASDFVIHPSLGELYKGVHTTFDYETKSEYSITVVLSAGNSTDSVDVTVEITDVVETENQAPVIEGDRFKTFSIDEDADIGDRVEKIKASDPDDDDITYELTGEGAGDKFTITSEGELNVAGKLDHETKTAYLTRVTVSDGKLTDRSTITINIGDINEPPVFANNTPTEFEVAEDTAFGADFGSAITATDPEEDAIRYQLRGDSRYFAYNLNTNKLQVRTVFDYDERNSYSVTLRAIAAGGRADHDIAINITDVIETPKRNRFLRNFPNPFNPETWIPYELAEVSWVSLKIYDMRGKTIREINLGIQQAGYYTTKGTAAHWDGKNSFGELVASGIYFYELQTNNLSVIKKMVILK